MVLQYLPSTLLQRDQYTNNELPIDDVVLSEKQTDIHNRNRDASSRSKAHGEKFANSANVKVGGLVYIKNGKQKNSLCDRYIITPVFHLRLSEPSIRGDGGIHNHMVLFCRIHIQHCSQRAGA